LITLLIFNAAIVNKTLRDNFTRQTIAELARGVGYRCSNPNCWRPTDAANEAQDGTISIGVAAHICAAAHGGPRYDASQSPEARRDRDNGIWLCQSCSRLVDVDPDKFTEALLRGWKYDAQAQAFREILAPGNTEESTRIATLSAVDARAARTEAADALFRKVRSAAEGDLLTFRTGSLWASPPVELTLRLADKPDLPPFKINNLPPALEIAPEATIVAPPGTGKTTTVLQLAGEVIEAGHSIPLYFRLGDWSAGSSTLIASLQSRAAFRDVATDDILKLAERGLILLLIDGWNELDAAAQTKLRLELIQLRRDCPHIRIVATTRQRARDVPTRGPRVEIEPLSEEQQTAIGRAMGGDDGAKIVDEAWRTPGVRQLIAMPLYLTALVSGGLTEVRPETKEQLLRLFVEQHERATEHAEPLHALLRGCHGAVLAALASELNAKGLTTISEEEARRFVSTALALLVQDRQIYQPPEPADVLAVLTDHHTLMSGGGSGSISFQHQQFQEWFASREVEDLIRRSASGDAGARIRLRAAIFDQPAWEESIYFAVERISRAAEGPAIAAAAIRTAMTVDPMLAAEMIFRITEDTWLLVKDDVLTFADRWHHAGHVDRAIQFMVTTGRSEFEKHVWPLASNPNSQVQLPTLRSTTRFRPAVLGTNVRAKIAVLPDEERQRLLSLIAAESGVDGMDLATEIAKADPSAKVQAEVIQYLLFRRADRHVADLLSAAHPETWRLIAQQGYADEVRDAAISARLKDETVKLLNETASPSKRLSLLLHQPPDFPDREALIAAAIADPAYPVRDSHAANSIYLAQERAPAGIRDGLRKRLEAGLELPFHADDFLEQLEVTDDGPIATAILDVKDDKGIRNPVALLAGPQTVAALVDRFLECTKAARHDRMNQQLWEMQRRLRDRLAMTRASLLIAAILERANTTDIDHIHALAELIYTHGDDDARKRSIPPEPSTKPKMVAALRAWTGTVIASQDSWRYDLCEVAEAIGRSGIPELLPELKQLLDEDQARLEAAKAKAMEQRRRGNTIDSDITGYGVMYRDAFTRLGEASAEVVSQYLERPSIATDAAFVLQALSNRQLKITEPAMFRSWPWLDQVTAARAARASAHKPPPANEFAEPIFAAVDRLATPDGVQQKQGLAIVLARIALGMPHGDRDSLIDRVMALPRPLKEKRELIAAMTLDGRIIDAAVIEQAIDEWLVEAEKNAWHSRQETWEIEPWLELLPFSSRPSSVFNALAKVKAFYGSGWAKRWERVLRSLASVPGTDGEKLLGELVVSHKDIADDYTWMRTILGRNTPSSVLLFVDLYMEGVLGRGPHASDAWHVGRELAKYVEEFPELMPQLLARYENADSRSREMLEHLFGEAGGEIDLVAMVKTYAATGRPFDARMARAIEAVAVRHVPVEKGSNSYYTVPATVGGVRKTLFGLMDGDPTVGKLASQCLVGIDRLRDDHGIAADDPRHPDVARGKAWPPEAAQFWL
jgi:hypothetical protein